MVAFEVESGNNALSTLNDEWHCMLIHINTNNVHMLFFYSNNDEYAAASSTYSTQYLWRDFDRYFF